MGTLYIVSTPIGNLEDITIRALHTLFSVDCIACEDTRVTGQLLELLTRKYTAFIPHKKKSTFVTYHDNNEETIMPELIEKLERGMSVALVSDAGTPLISDPGYRIVDGALKHNIPIQVIPGVTAFVTALTASGLPASSFTFLGFLPEKQGRRLAGLRNIKKSFTVFPSTYICYVAPHKLIQTLEDLKSVYGDIRICIGRELTKMHEEQWAGTLSQAHAYFHHPKGEFVLLFTPVPVRLSRTVRGFASTY